jgi:hypothetical protein
VPLAERLAIGGDAGDADEFRRRRRFIE